MKLFKKALCLLLAALMLLGMAACAGDPVESNPSDKPTSGTQGSDGPKYDFGGKTLKIAVWYEPEKPTLGNSDSEDAWYYSLKHAAEEFNCEIEWIIDTQEAHFSNFIQKSLAGEVYADIFMCHSWNYISLIDQGLILPTTEYIENCDEPERWEQNLFNFKGENWGLEPARNKNYTPNLYMLVNTKLLSSLNLEHPQELARRGEWTWEKFREYCSAATDPTKEQFGVGCFMIAAMLKSTNGFDYAVPDENGVYHNGFTYEATKQNGLEILELIQKMSQEDKSILGTWTDGQEALDETLNAFKDGKLLFAYNPTPASIKKSGFTDYSVVTVPLGPHSDGLNDTIDAFAFWSLPKESNFTAEERAAFWMEAKNTWDPEDEDGYYEASEEDVVQILWDTTWMTEADAQFMLDMGKTIKIKPGANVSWGSLIADEVFGAIMRGEVTPAAVIAQKDGEIQSLIDATYNKKD